MTELFECIGQHPYALFAWNIVVTLVTLTMRDLIRKWRS